ncbi:MAG: stage II sporulation protein M [Candidatus Bathyarchaeia archaeon]
MRIMRYDPSNQARVLALILAFLISLAITFAGTLSSMSPSEAQVMKEEFEEVASSMMNVPAIFQNNLMYALLMFIPVLGPLSAFYVLYSTGRYVAAFAMVSGENPAAFFMLMFIFPHGWIEYTAYALAISQSLWLTLRIAQRRALKAEVKSTGMSIAACAALLLLGAVVEMMTIQLLR